MLTFSQVNPGDTSQNMVLIAAKKIPACEATIQVSSPAVTQTKLLSVAEKKMSTIRIHPVIGCLQILARIFC